MQKAPWLEIKRQNFTSLPSLAEYLGIPLTSASHFPLNLPRRLAEKIEKGQKDDPLLRQFVPLTEEGEAKPGFSNDPVGDLSAQKSSKLLHKYHGRALLVTSSACAMHCRYCFRQHYDYSPSKGFAQELALLRQDTSLREVILSGGDPLSLPNRQLEDLIHELEAIPHLTRLRFHTRFPLGIPERIDEGFLSLLNGRLQRWFVIHCNHPRELDADVLEALAHIRTRGVPVLNQAVLLKGVNDSVHTLQELCETLADHGIVSYYLHQLDRVEGAAHFEVSEEQGKALMAELSTRLSGYAMPRYVREESGAPGKTPIA